MSNTHLVWWLTQAELELLVIERGSITYPNMPRSLPAWLIDQVISCHGRPGRGRLWVCPDLNLPLIEMEEVAQWTTPLRLHTNSCYGIVIPAEVVPHLRDLPGIITNLNYQRIS